MRKKILFCFLTLILVTILIACSDDEALINVDIHQADWSEIEELAEGTEVNFYMWGGNNRINKWIDDYATSSLKEDYSIKLNRVPMGPADYLNQLLNEKQLEREEGSIDLVWINGENFQIARNNELLFGPFAEMLPNYQQYLDGECPSIIMDFGFPTDGYESPWGKAQFTFTYDKARTEEPPYTFDEFIEWIKENPGQFTYPDPTVNFTGSVFVRHIIYEIAGGYEEFQNIKDDNELREKIKPALEFLSDLKPYLWREGQSYPATTAQLNNMFVDGELMASMSYSSISASGEIASGNYPDTVRTFVLENGTISDTHFLAVPFNSSNKAGALITANFLLSFEAQIKKFDPDLWGDLPVFSYEKLNSEERQELEELDLGIATLPQEVLDSHSLPEMDSSFVPIIEAEWNKIVNQ